MLLGYAFSEYRFAMISASRGPILAMAWLSFDDVRMKLYNSTDEVSINPFSICAAIFLINFVDFS